MTTQLCSTPACSNDAYTLGPDDLCYRVGPRAYGGQPEARAVCESEGGRLAEIKNEEQFYFLQGMVSSLAENWFWIGVVDASSGPR